MEPADSDQDREVRYKTYLARRELLAKQEFEASRDCDRWTLTAAGAALALSVTFIKDIIGPGQISVSVLLAGGWLLLVLAVASVLLSLHLGRMAHRHYEKCLNRADGEGIDATFWSRVRKYEDESTLGQWTERTANWGAALTIFGLLCLLGFVFANTLSKGSPVGNPSSSSQPTCATAPAAPGIGSSSGAGPR